MVTRFMKMLHGSFVVALFVLLLSPSTLAQGQAAGSQPSIVKKTGKLVHFSIRNDGQHPLHLKSDDRTLEIAPEQVLDLKLPLGSQVLFIADEWGHQDGHVMTVVSSSLGGAVISAH